MKRLLGLCLVASMLLPGCTDNGTQPTGSGTAPPSPPPSAAVPATVSAEELARLKQPDSQEVVLQMKRGKITFELFPNAAPLHVARIKDLVTRHYYDRLLFHRVIPDFMIQFGDPNTRSPNRALWGSGGGDVPTLKAEFNPIPHQPGILSMARTADPNSASTQFFICVGKPSYLDGKYTVFGQVTSGQEIAQAVSTVPKDKRDAPLVDEMVEKAYLIPTPKSLLAPAPASSATASASASATASASTSPAAVSPSASASPH